MRKRFSILAICMMCCAAAVVMTSCSDDNSSPKQETDNGEWLVSDDMMDKSTRPGDDFFMYCNGGFWQNTTVDEDKADINSWIKVGLQNIVNERIAALHFPSQEKMLTDAGRMDANAVTHQRNKMQSVIDRINDVTSLEEMWKLTAQLMLEGYRCPFKLNVLSHNGRMAAYLSCNFKDEFAASFLEKDNDLSWRINHDANVLACAKPLAGKSTRSFDTEQWPMLKIIFENLGISLEDAYIIAAVPDQPDIVVQGQMKAFQQLQNLDLDTWKQEIMLPLINQDKVCFDDEELGNYNQEKGQEQTRADLVKNFAKRYLNYETSKIYTDAYVTPEMKRRTLDMCIQMREVLHQRIENNEWMSAQSKHNAIEKLEAMTFCIGCPDEWFDEGLPDLSQESTLFDDVLAVRRAQLNLNRRLIGMETVKVSFHAIINNQHDLTTVNAFYSQNYNSMNIYPIWIMDPVYNPNANEAHNYVSCTVFGHEITHGFDTNGAKFNKMGDLGEIWASQADKEEFLRRAQLLIDYYSQTEVMPWSLPGLCNQGDYTVSENIADLGGFLIAYETYEKHLQDNGFKGDQLKLQCQRFFLSYAYLWQAKYSAKYAQVRTLGEGDEHKDKDIHSLPRERVNGIVRNVDYWYDLFPIEPTDKLYLAPADRVRIW